MARGILNDLTGQRFGMLTVIKRGPNGNTRGARWICQCDCGGQSVVWGRNLGSGSHSESCGCQRWSMPPLDTPRANWHRQYLKDRRFIGKRLIDATGTKRRLQALVYAGWPMRALDRRLDFQPGRCHKLVLTDLVKRSTAHKVAQLYDELWDKPAPKQTRVKAHNQAKAKGWAPCGAWDDDQIDDPKVRPRIGTSKKSERERLAA